MNLAFSTNAYMRFSVEQALTRLASLGYLGVELMADVPHAWPAGLLPEQKRGIRDTLDRLGLAISNINAFMMNAIADPRQPYWHPSWIEPDSHYRRIRVEHTKRALTLAKELRAPNITTEPGGPLAPGQTFEQGLDQFVGELKPVVEHAEREGVMLLVEPEPGLLIEKADQYLAFAERIRSPMLGLNFDIGHQYCVGEDPAASIRKLAPHIRHVHLEDIAATRVHHHMIPGDGAIDFRSVVAALREINYRGWVTIELYPYVDDPDRAARTAFERIGPLIASPLIASPSLPRRAGNPKS
jgi:sugar phosphate isomerase/epimerase